MRFEVVTAVRIKMAVFWVVEPCSLVEVYRRFRDVPTSGLIALMMEAASTCETSVNFYQTTRRNIPDDIFKSHAVLLCLRVKIAAQSVTDIHGVRGAFEGRTQQLF
jgi:hypothetical protein